VAFAYPETLGAGILDTVLGTKENRAFEALLSIAMPDTYGANWMQQISPITYAEALKIAKSLPYYYKRGYAFRDWKSFSPAIKKAFPKIPGIKISVYLNMLTGISSQRYPAYIELLKTGVWKYEAVSEQVIAMKTKELETAAEEITDKLRRGVGAIAESSKTIVDAASDVLPWYLKPKVLLPIGIGAAVLFLLGYSGAGKMIFRPKEKKLDYLPNPISKSDAAIEKFKEFHDRAPKRTKRIPRIDTEHLTQLGDALEIGYRSKKWTGKNENYLHRFGKGVSLMCTPDGKNLIISGGKLGVSDRGIIN